MMRERENGKDVGQRREKTSVEEEEEDERCSTEEVKEKQPMKDECLPS